MPGRRRPRSILQLNQSLWMNARHAVEEKNR
jgi:hypothetical protein